MNWGSVAEFLAMGGYAAFVWGSYAVAAACIAGEVALVLRRLRRARGEAPGASVR
ncbi:MAG: heme exporter protein CcmD [Burkholderiales bacterium]|nr:heme exporter protein CcmD [Burkholderiales bacterium]MDW8469128.1 heme exporter protein CcmD [Burkholderiales bacterium]